MLNVEFWMLVALLVTQEETEAVWKLKLAEGGVKKVRRIRENCVVIGSK